MGWVSPLGATQAALTRLAHSPLEFEFGIHVPHLGATTSKSQASSLPPCRFYCAMYLLFIFLHGNLYQVWPPASFVAFRSSPSCVSVPFGAPLRSPVSWKRLHLPSLDYDQPVDLAVSHPTCVFLSFLSGVPRASRPSITWPTSSTTCHLCL